MPILCVEAAGGFPTLLWALTIVELTADEPPAIHTPNSPYRRLAKS
jgi:hypothetical protein